MTHVWLVYEVDPYAEAPPRLVHVFESRDAAQYYIDQRYAATYGTLDRDVYWPIETWPVLKG